MPLHAATILCGKLVHRRCQQGSGPRAGPPCWTTFLGQIAKADLLVIDDVGLAPRADPTRRDLLKPIDNEYDRKSTLITSQLLREPWRTYLEDQRIADAILDRLTRNRHRLVLKGDSMRKLKTIAAAVEAVVGHRRPSGAQRKCQRPSASSARHHEDSRREMRWKWGSVSVESARSGAGGRSRTYVISLESRYSAVELHPRFVTEICSASG